MRYRILLSDADGTLFDFHRGERVAISETFERFSIPVTDENILCYHQANDVQWKRLERGETTFARLRLERFEVFLAEAGLAGDPQALCDDYIERMARQRFLLPGALDFVRTVSAHMPVWLVTNGIAAIQHGRFDGCEIAPYVSGMVVSEEVGHAKPDPAILLEALRQAGGLSPKDAVLLGDSVTADISAARNAGIHSLLFTNGNEPPEGHGADRVVRGYDEALAALGL